ncbi:MAG: imidazolonepropionase, partial [Sphingobacteriales bacterium]
MTTLFINIRSLVGVRAENVLLRGAALAELPCINDAFLLVENGIIAAFGPMYELEIQVPDLPAVVMD